MPQAASESLRDLAILGLVGVFDPHIVPSLGFDDGGTTGYVLFVCLLTHICRQDDSNVLVVFSLRVRSQPTNGRNHQLEAGTVDLVARNLNDTLTSTRAGSSTLHMGPLECCPSTLDVMSIPRSRHLHFLPNLTALCSLVLPSSALHERCAGMEQSIHALTQPLTRVALVLRQVVGLRRSIGLSPTSFPDLLV